MFTAAAMVMMDWLTEIWGKIGPHVAHGPCAAPETTGTSSELDKYTKRKISLAGGGYRCLTWKWELGNMQKVTTEEGEELGSHLNPTNIKEMSK